MVLLRSNITIWFALLSQHKLEPGSIRGSSFHGHQPSVNFAGTSICFFSSSKNKVWIIDSGASDHISPHLSQFMSYRFMLNTSFITMPDGSQACVKHIGSVKLHDDIILHDVLHVPQFKYNLLYVQKLTTQLCSSMILSPNKCLL